MPVSKDYSFREMIYDQCFSTGKEYTCKQLMGIVNRRLEERGMKLIQSRTTFMQDMAEMNEKFYHLYNKYGIVWEDRHKKRYYRYKGGIDSIYNHELTMDEVEKLQEVRNLLQGFKGMPEFGWIDQMMTRLDQNIIGKQKEIASFESGTNKDAKFLMQLFNAISNRQVLDVGYQRFGTETRVHVIHPYYLKQYRLRWYLFARIDKKDGICCFALDRIVSVSNNNDVKYRGTKVSFKHYFDDIVGVTKPEGEVVEHIELWADRTLLPYLKTSPIHKTQHIESKDDWGCIVTLDVMINYELEQELMFYGDNISVMAPEHFRQHMIERLRRNLSVYEKVHF